jgi:hypothetical protein
MQALWLLLSLLHMPPPSFRFSGGLASPSESSTGRLTRPYDVQPGLVVQDQPHASTAVVSAALASWQ